jgi:ABC-type protease/lipase transport system fused ATPase/permease subunit
MNQYSSQSLYDLEAELQSVGDGQGAEVARQCAAKMAGMESILKGFPSGYQPRLGEVRALVSAPDDSDIYTGREFW